MDIYLNNAIMHIIDNERGNVIYSSNELDIDSDMITEFLTKHIKKLTNNIAVKNATFLPESSVFSQIEEFKAKNIDFKTLSRGLCEKLAALMLKYRAIPSASVIFVQMDIGRYPHLAIIKLNHRNYYTHEAVNDETRLVRSNQGLPFDSGKVEEAVLIPYSPMVLKLVEKSYPLEKGLDESDYFSLLFLECEPELSKKTVVEIINNAINDIEEIHGFVPACKIKLGIIDEALENDGEVRLEQMAQYLDDEIKAEFLQYLKDYGLNKDVFLGDKFASQKFGLHKVKSTNGVEIKFPIGIFDDANAINFIDDEGILTANIRGIKRV